MAEGKHPANAAAAAKPAQKVDKSKSKCEVSDKPRKGVVLSIHPVLFESGNTPPKELDAFKRVSTKMFNDYFLLADGVQEAAIDLQIVDVDCSTDKKLVGSSASGGEVVVKANPAAVGILIRKSDDGKPIAKGPKDTDSELHIPVADVKGVLKNCFFKMNSGAVGTSAKITCTIENPDPSYVYASSVTIPKNENWNSSLIVQTREIKNNTDPHVKVEGYDVMKLQWYLRRLGYYKKTANGDDSECDGHFGSACLRALNRFQRRAKGPYRNKRGTKPDQTDVNDAKTTELFGGDVNGDANQKTIEEIIKWFNKDWVAPLGRLGTQNVIFETESKKLRSDLVTAFTSLKKDIIANGCIIKDGGSTLRSFDQGTGASTGRSKTSAHYCGIAIDISQDNKTYFPIRDPLQPVGTKPYTAPYWEILAISTNKKGTEQVKGFKKTYNWAERGVHNPTGKDQDLAAGNYISITEIFARNGFVSIVPHQNYEKDGNYNGQEWWHFQYQLSGTPHLQDEVELLSADYTEKFLKGKGLTDKQLDGPPQ